jgi:hypothetical protein
MRASFFSTSKMPPQGFELGLDGGHAFFQVFKHGTSLQAADPNVNSPGRG